MYGTLYIYIYYIVSGKKSSRLAILKSILEQLKKAFRVTTIAMEIDNILPNTIKK